MVRFSVALTLYLTCSARPVLANPVPDQGAVKGLKHAPEQAETLLGFPRNYRAERSSSAWP